MIGSRRRFGVRLVLATLWGIVLAMPVHAGRDCSSITGATPQETERLRIQCEGWSFRETAQKVAATEPFLHSSAQFAQFQSWTLANQLYIPKNIDELARIFVVPPAAVRQDQLARTYGKFAATYTRLSQELPDHLALHRSMFTDLEHDREYMRKYDLAIRTLLPEGQAGEYQPIDCDYMAQPLNALWFSLNAARLLDRYGLALFGDAWTAGRDQLLSEQRLLAPAALIPMVRAGVPYVPAPQLTGQPADAAPGSPAAPALAAGPAPATGAGVRAGTTPLLGVGRN